MSDEPIESLAERGANVMHAAFLSYRAEFNAITRRAQIRFEQRDWHGMQNDALERLKNARISLDRVDAQGLGGHSEKARQFVEEAQTRVRQALDMTNEKD